MLVISCRIAQSAALVFETNVSWITTTDSVLIFISQHIWIKISILLGILIINVSNGSGLPGLNPGKNQTKDPGAGQEPPSNPNRVSGTGLLSGPYINLWFFGRVVPGQWFHFTVPPTFAPIKYLSSDRTMTWSGRRLCSFSRPFTYRCEICDWTNIRWLAGK